MSQLSLYEYKDWRMMFLIFLKLGECSYLGMEVKYRVKLQGYRTTPLTVFRFIRLFEHGQHVRPQLRARVQLVIT